MGHYHSGQKQIPEKKIYVWKRKVLLMQQCHLAEPAFKWQTKRPLNHKLYVLLALDNFKYKLLLKSFRIKG